MSIAFRLKYLLASRLNILHILVLPLRHNHLAWFRNDQYGGRTEDSPRIDGHLGFSICKTWSIPYNSDVPEERATFIEKMKGMITRWKGWDAPCWPSTRPPYGTRSRRAGDLGGGKGAVRVNYSKRVMHLIEALGDGTLDLQFHEDLEADSYADLAEYASRCHKKIGSKPATPAPRRQNQTESHHRHGRSSLDEAARICCGFYSNFMAITTHALLLWHRKSPSFSSE